MDGGEALLAALEAETDEIDHDRGAVHGARNRFGVAEVGLHRLHLPHIAQRPQMPGEVGAAHRHADAVTLVGEQLHQLGADKAGATKDGDELVVGGIHGDAPQGDYLAPFIAKRRARRGPAAQPRAGAAGNCRRGGR